MARVLFKGIKTSKHPVGNIIRNIRFNRNLLQKEFETLLDIKTGSCTRIEHGKMSIDNKLFEKMKEVFCLTEVEIKEMNPFIVEHKKKNKTIDPKVYNLGTYVSELRKERNFTEFNLSIAMNADRNLIACIEGHSQPFTLEELLKLKIILNLNPLEESKLNELNDWFEFQPKPNRPFRDPELRIKNTISLIINNAGNKVVNITEAVTALRRDMYGRA